jgi:hypothetical protein
MNTDPFEHYSDEKDWQGMENSDLMQQIASLPNGLANLRGRRGDRKSKIKFRPFTNSSEYFSLKSLEKYSVILTMDLF